MLIAFFVNKTKPHMLLDLFAGSKYRGAFGIAVLSRFHSTMGEYESIRKKNLGIFFNAVCIFLQRIPLDGLGQLQIQL